MTMRGRKLVGAFVLIALLFVWLFLGLVLAPLVLPSAGPIGTIAFYTVGGLGWLVFAMPLVKWMARPGPQTAAPPS